MKTSLTWTVHTLTFSVFLFLAATQDRPSQRAQSYRIVDRQEYEEVIDLVFRNHEPADKNIDQFILYSEPSRRPESILTIAWQGAKNPAVECTAANGQIWTMLNDMLNRTGTVDKDAAVKSVRLDCRNIQISRDQANRWRSEFFKSLSESVNTMLAANEKHQATGKVVVTLDSTNYRINYLGYPADISLVIQDANLGLPGSHSQFKVVEWMRDIRQEVNQIR